MNRSGAVLLDGKFFIASPQMAWIPQPPLGEHEVFMRKNFRFGDDDYLQWPQCTEGYPYMAAILRKPINTNDPKAVLWWDPPAESADFVHIHSNLFKLSDSRFSQLQGLVQESRSAVENYVTSHTPIHKDDLKSSILETANVVENFWTRISVLPMVRTDLRHSIAELQRYLLELDAFLAWETVYRKRIQGLEPATTKVDLRMGCFTYDPNVVSDFVRAGLPVWFIQSVNKLAHTRIDELVHLRPPMTIELNECQPKYPTIFKGWATDVKRISMIRLNARISLHTADVFFLARPIVREAAPIGSKNALKTINAHQGISVHHHPCAYH
jgi:hypothetical protein